MVAGSKTQRVRQAIRERHPEPIVGEFTGVTGNSEEIPVNPWEGFYSDIMFKVKASSPLSFILREAGENPENLDDSLSSSNAVLRAIIRKSDQVNTLYLEPSSGGVSYDFKYYLTRHRVTGAI